MRLALAALGEGRMTGVDISPEMVRRARRAFQDEIAAGRLAVVEASVEALPVPQATFDGAYTVNTIYFWVDVGAGLAELRRVIRPGGRLVITTVSAAVTAHRIFFETSAPTPEVVIEQMRRVGFAEVSRRAGRGIESVLACRP